MTLREVASIYRSDLTLMISSYEMEILLQELNIPNELLFHLPFMVDVSEISKRNLLRLRHELAL